MENNKNIPTRSTEPDETAAALSVPPETTNYPGSIEALRSKNEELKRKLLLANSREQLVTSLQKAGASSPDVLYEAVKGSLQFDEHGELVRPDEVIADAKRKFPGQFGMPRPPVSIDAGTGTNAAASTLSKERLAAMTPAQVRSLDWQEVRRILTER